MGMRRLRTQAGRAGIPTEMVKLIAGMRGLDRAEDFRIGRRFRIDVDDGYPVGLLSLRIERRHIGERLRRRLRRLSGRGIEARIGLPRCHECRLQIQWSIAEAILARLFLQRSLERGCFWSQALIRCTTP